LRAIRLHFHPNINERRQAMQIIIVLQLMIVTLAIDTVQLASAGNSTDIRRGQFHSAPNDESSLLTRPAGARPAAGTKAPLRRPKTYSKDASLGRSHQETKKSVKSGGGGPPGLVVGQRPPAEAHVVVIDCGSSGSRVQIYHWPRTATRGTFANQVQPLRDPANNRPLSLRIRPGLSSVRDNPSTASDYLVPLMRFASKNVPEQQHKTTPVYIMGTAGLRALSLSERASILEDVMRDLRSEFQFENIFARVISGSEEGFFQWLSVNKLAGRLGADFNQAQGPSFHYQLTSSRRYGLVEMGGYSTQVAFEITPAMAELISRQLKRYPEAQSVFQRLRLQVSLPGGGGGQQEQSLSVFAVSFLGFGGDNARSLAIDLMARDAIRRLNRNNALLPMLIQTNSTLIVDDPCLPRNSEDSMVKPLKLLYSPTRTIGGYTARPNEQTILVRLVGRGNFAQCQALISRLLSIAKREQTTCIQMDSHRICDAPLIGTNFVPWRQLQFIGVGNLYYVPNMLRSAGHFNGLAHLHLTAALCSRTIEEIDKDHPADDEFSRMRNTLACFKATWILGFLSIALRMPLDGSVDLVTTDKIRGEEVDWKLGAVVALGYGYSGPFAAA
jgi:hypothetical protein